MNVPPLLSSYSSFNEDKSNSFRRTVTSELMLKLPELKSNVNKENESLTLVVRRSISWKGVENELEKITSTDAKIRSWVERWQKDIESLRGLDRDMKRAIACFRENSLPENEKKLIDTRGAILRVLREWDERLKKTPQELRGENDPRRKFIEYVSNNWEGLRTFVNHPDAAMDDDNKAFVFIESSKRPIAPRLDTKNSIMSVAFSLFSSEKGEISAELLRDQGRERSSSSASFENITELLYKVQSSPGGRDLAKEPFPNNSRDGIWANSIYHLVLNAVSDVNQILKPNLPPKS